MTFLEKSQPAEPDLEPSAAVGEEPIVTTENPTTAKALATWAPVLQLANLQRERGWPDAHFARSIKFDYSGSVWAKIKVGSFNGSLPKAIASIKRANAFTQTGRHIDHTEGGIVLLDHILDAENAVTLARHATDDHRLVIVVGHSGAGKTVTLNYLTRKFGGNIIQGLPSWGRSELSAVTGLAEGLGIVEEIKTVRQGERAILASLQAVPRLVPIDEANYFNAYGLNLIKTIINKSSAAVVIGTLPDALRRMNAEHNHETLQLVRRAVAIVQISPVDPATVTALAATLAPGVHINGHAAALASFANRSHRADTVARVLDETEPGNPDDLPVAIERVERAIRIKSVR